MKDSRKSLFWSGRIKKNKKKNRKIEKLSFILLSKI